MASHRRFRLFVPLALLCSAICLAFGASAASAVIPPSTFEGNDGNILTDTTLDWEDLPGIVERSDDLGDSQFGTGSKEQDPGQWDLNNGSQPGKSDILHAAYGTQTIFNATTSRDNLFFYGAFQRVAGDGNANVSFELNKVPGLYDNGTDQVPIRSEGDLLITFDGNNSGGVTVRMCIWHGDREGESSGAAGASTFGWYTLPGFTGSTANKLKGSDNCTLLSSAVNPTAEGSMNNGTISNDSDPTAAVDKVLNNMSNPIADNLFGETSVNVTEALIRSGVVSPCLDFGSIWLHTRSSDTPLSNMQDYVGPSALQAGSGCSIDLEKFVAVQKPGGPAPGANDYADADDEAGAVFASAGDTLHYLVTVTNNGSNDITMDTDPPTDDKCTLTLVSKKDGNGAADATTGVLNVDDVWTYSCTRVYNPLVDGNLLTNIATAIGHQGAPPAQPCTAASPLPCVSDTDPANVKPFGRIVIVKQQIGGTASDPFTFTPDADLAALSTPTPALDGNGKFSLTDNNRASNSNADASNTETFVDVVPNGSGTAYTVGEDSFNANGYRLTDITCDDPVAGNASSNPAADAAGLTSGSADIHVDPAETVTCVFTNTKNAAVRIVKQQIGGTTADPFVFTPSGSLVGASTPNPALNAGKFSLTDGDLNSGSNASGSNLQTFADVVPGSGYTVGEDGFNTGGYRLTDITCDDPVAGNASSNPAANAAGLGSGTATINADPGETVTCTYTNTKNAAVRIVKQQIGGTTADPFVFTPNGGLVGASTPNPALNAGKFSLTDGDLNSGSNASGSNLQTFADVVPASGYTVGEDGFNTGGYRLTDITCDNPVAGNASSNPAANAAGLGSGTATINVDPGETVTCTYTNTKNATVRVVKQQVGGTTADPFDFTPGGGLAGASSPNPALNGGKFTLTDGDLNSGSNASGTNLQTFADAIPNGGGAAYTVAEDNPNSNGYRLTDITCDDPVAGNASDDPAADPAGLNSGSVDVHVDPGETVTCTYTNTKNGTVEIEKINNAGAASDSFGYDASAALGPDFSLLGGQVETIGDVIPNSGPGSSGASYTVTEGPTAAGYRLNALTCTDANSSGSTATRTATLNVEAGETVRCTFTNGFSSPGIAIDKSGPATATSGDLLPYTIVVTNPGQEPLSDVVVTDPQCTTPPVLQVKNRGADLDASPDTLDPGDSWVYTCSGQTQDGQTSFVNQACVEAHDEFGRVVNACDDVTTVLGQQEVLPDVVVLGQARLAGRSGCVAKSFFAVVRGRQIDKVVFRIDGKKRATVGSPDSKGRFKLKVNPKSFKAGSHLLVARATFVADSNTRPKTMRLRFQRCVRRQAPAFTG